MAGLSARYVRPADLTWWMQPLGSFLPFVGAAVVCVALVRLWRTSWRVRIAYAAVLLWLGVRFVGPMGQPAPPGEDDLTVVSFNAPTWNGRDGRIQARHVLAYAGEVRPEVLALQEAARLFHHDRWQRLEILPMRAQLRAFGYRSERIVEQQATSQPVLTRRLAVLSAGTMQLHDGDGYDPTDVARMVLRADSAQPFVLYNLHLTTHGERKPWRDPAFSLRRPDTWRMYVRRLRRSHLRRALEADRLRARLDADGPVCLAVVGDFNATPHEWAFGRVAGAQGGLVDALGRVGRGWNATFHRDLPLVRIDHVLLSPGWPVVAARRPVVDASDHRPVEVRLRPACR